MSLVVDPCMPRAWLFVLQGQLLYQYQTTCLRKHTLTHTHIRTYPHTHNYTHTHHTHAHPPIRTQLHTYLRTNQWRIYIGARGLSPQIMKKEGFSPPNSKGWYIFFRWSGNTN